MTKNWCRVIKQDDYDILVFIGEDEDGQDAMITKFHWKYGMAEIISAFKDDVDPEEAFAKITDDMLIATAELLRSEVG